MARDSGGPAAPKTEVFTSLTTEVLFAANLVASAPGSRSGIDEDWVSRQRHQLPATVAADLKRFEGLWWPTMGLCDLLCFNNRYQDVDGFVADAESMPLERFLALLFNGDLSRDQIQAALRQGPSSDWRLERFSKFSEGTNEAYTRIFADPEGHRRALLRLVLASDTPLFREEYLRFTRDASTTIQSLQTRLSHEDPMVVVESLRTQPLRGPRSFDTFTFVPSRLVGHRHIFSSGGGHATFFLQDGALALHGPTEVGAELADFLKVLGDRTRMDILRLLCAGPSYGKEIAASLGLTTATVSRHLDQLKAAGLVAEDRADANNVKLLRYVPGALDGQIDRLRTYLLHSSS